MWVGSSQEAVCSGAWNTTLIALSAGQRQILVNRSKFAAFHGEPLSLRLIQNFFEVWKQVKKIREKSLPNPEPVASSQPLFLQSLVSLPLPLLFAPDLLSLSVALSISPLGAGIFAMTFSPCASFAPRLTRVIIPLLVRTIYDTPCFDSLVSGVWHFYWPYLIWFGVRVLFPRLGRWRPCLLPKARSKSFDSC